MFQAAFGHFVGSRPKLPCFQAAFGCCRIQESDLRFQAMFGLSGCLLGRLKSAPSPALARGRVGVGVLFW